MILIGKCSTDENTSSSEIRDTDTLQVKYKKVNR